MTGTPRRLSPTPIGCRQKLCTIIQFMCSLARFIHEGAESGLWGDEITSNMMASG